MTARFYASLAVGCGLVAGTPALVYQSQSVYTVITAVPAHKPLDAITQQRPSVKELKRLRSVEDSRVKQMTKTFWLPEHLSGYPMETWPEPLHMFAYYLSREPSSYAPSAPETISNLRKFYPDDKVLMQFADFLEAARKNDPDATFKDDYKRVLLPRSPDASIKLW